MVGFGIISKLDHGFFIKKKKMLSIFKNLFSPASDSSELSKVIKKGAFLVDVRSTYEFSFGSVQGAINIPLGEVKNQLKKLQGKENIVVFCRSGARSGQAKSILEQNGFQNVFNGGSAKNVNRILNQ